MRKFFSAVTACVFLCAAALCGEEPEAPALGKADIPTPIVETEVGDWALYATADGSSLKLTVVERWTEHGDDHLIIRSETTPPGKRRRRDKPLVSEEQVSVKERVADARDLGVFDFVTEAEVLVDGRKLRAVIVNYVEDGKVARQSWFCADVPVYGLLRGVRIDGETRTTALNLKEFGVIADGE